MPYGSGYGAAKRDPPAAAEVREDAECAPEAAGETPEAAGSARAAAQIRKTVVNTDKYFEKCILCPRKCAVDRRARAGFCGCGSILRAARAGLHYFEEPFLSGIRGSGTVFFTGCNLRCVYCQNSTISGPDGFGVEIDAARLAEIFLEQQHRGAHNINLVTGTPYIPVIAEALEAARKNLNIPVIWNSSGYESCSSLEMLDGLVDIWLPDFKTLDPELGSRYMNAPDYPEEASGALEWMVKHCRGNEFISLEEEEKELFGHSLKEEKDKASGINSYTREDIEECGIMKSGVCVRHLVIPGQIRDSKNVLKYLYDTFGDSIWISVMSQYTPMREDFSAQELNRRLSEEEYDEVVDYAIDLGIDQCMIQGMDVADESFIPIFDGTGILR